MHLFPCVDRHIRERGQQLLMDVDSNDRCHPGKYLWLYHCSICVGQYWMALGILHPVNHARSNHSQLLYHSGANCQFEENDSIHTRVSKEASTSEDFNAERNVEGHIESWL